MELYTSAECYTQYAIHSFTYEEMTLLEMPAVSKTRLTNQLSIFIHFISSENRVRLSPDHSPCSAASSEGLSHKHSSAPEWAIQWLLWRREDLASLSTAAHATLNTPDSP